MSHTHAFGNLLKQLRTRVPGLTQARLAELAGYDPAVITRMAKGQQDLTGPQTRARVLRVIAALDEAGALRDVTEANALLAAANLSPLIEASAGEARLIQHLYRHSNSQSTPRPGAVSGTAPTYVRQLLQEYVRIWDKATNEGERMIILAAAGELAMRYGQPALGMRLLARRPGRDVCAGDRVDVTTNLCATNQRCPRQTWRCRLCQCVGSRTDVDRA